ncbi:MAG: hypothetical protein HY293_04335 [Planctomycetes bacterium]|nr:hypothetical protein [Planctomycetota bacterium]
MLNILALLLCLQEASPPTPQEPPRSSSASFLDPLQGMIRVKYRYRATSTESDTDLYEIISLNYGNAAKDPVTAALTARLAEDLDGNRNVQGYYPFTSLDDRYRSSATQRLYTAYMDFRPAGDDVQLRAGRQLLDEFPETVPMDGGLARLQAGAHVVLSLFGGLPVNLFESSPAGDAMYGASAEWAPDPQRRGRYRVEYLHLRDENILGLHQDDLVGFTMDEGSGPFTFHARYTMLEGKSRDFRGRLTAADPEAEFLLQLQGTYVFHRIEALSYALDPYATFLMDLQPYVDLSLRASKSFGEPLTIDASLTSRQLVRNAADTTYNHEFKRVELSPLLRNWPLEDVSFRVSADYWNSSADDFWTVGGDVSWECRRDLVLSAASSYALYSIDAFSGEEHDRVRTWSLSLKWKVSKGSVIDVRFSLEQNSIDTFRIFEAGFRHAF